MTSGGRAAVATGAARMGLAFAERFSAEEMNVALADIVEPALDDAVTILRVRGAQAVGIRRDVSSAQSVTNLAEAARSASGGIHVVCNNVWVPEGGTESPSVATCCRQGFMRTTLPESCSLEWDSFENGCCSTRGSRRHSCSASRPTPENRPLPP